MKTFTLQRVSYANACTFGVMKDEYGIPFMVTLELAWKDNQNNISCVPTGSYKAVRENSPKHGVVFELKDVKNREHIQIHIGNYPKDSLGCILVGTEFNGDDSINNSTIAFKKFMSKLKDENEFMLVITK